MQQPHAVRAHIRILWCGCAVAQGIAVCPSPARTRRAMTSATACAPICYTVGGKTVGMVRGNGGDSAMAVAVRYCGACGAGNNLRDAVCIRCKRPLPAVAADHPTGNMPPNMVLAHRYIIISQAGRGGMGAVYKARDQQAGGRIVAIKELSQSGLTPQEQAEAIQTFQHEADLLAGLRHAGLPRFYNRFSEGGRWYLVMDYIEGETLEEKLRKSGGRPLPVDQVIQVGIQLCAVLTYLHTRRPPIIFRDLKPANVMLTATGGLFLIDFGIARLFKPGKQADTMSFGSPGYAAPEQYGKAQTTARSDVFSLGATLHQLLTGIDPSVRPFEFVPVRTRNAQVPPELEALIARMVQLDERLRPADTASVQRELEIIRGRMGVHPGWPWAGAPAKTKAAKRAKAPKAPKIAKPAPAPKPRLAPPSIFPAQPRVVPVVAPSAPPLRQAVYPTPPAAFMRGSKRSILLLSLVSLGAFVWSVIESGRGLEGASLGKIGWGLLSLAVGLCLWFVAWLISMVRATQLARWGWFTSLLLILVFFGPFGTLLYGLFGPVERPK